MRGLSLAVAVAWGLLVGLILYELSPYVSALHAAAAALSGLAR